MNTESYKKDINDLRKKRDEKSASNPLDWINLAGLFWLEEGDNPFGSDENNKIVMSRFPHPQCGIFHFNGGLVTLQPASGVNITINGEIPSSRPLRTDREKTPDLMDIGPLTMKIIVRGMRPCCVSGIENRLFEKTLQDSSITRSILNIASLQNISHTTRPNR